MDATTDTRKSSFGPSSSSPLGSFSSNARGEVEHGDSTTRSITCAAAFAALPPTGPPHPTPPSRFSTMKTPPPSPWELLLLLRPRSRITTPLLLFLVPTTLGSLAAFPILCLCSIVRPLSPLPTQLTPLRAGPYPRLLLPPHSYPPHPLPPYVLPAPPPCPPQLTPGAVYSIPWILYLLLAQTDPPTNVRLPFLPLHPLRTTKITLYALRLLRDLVASQAISLFLDSQLRRVMVLGGKDAKTILKENVLYAEGGRRLDVYLPVREGRELAPVIVYVGGGNWRWWRKNAGAQTALRLRKLGYAVVVPELTGWPKGKTPDMVSRCGSGGLLCGTDASAGERFEACAGVDGGCDQDVWRRSGPGSCPGEFCSTLAKRSR